MTTAAPPVSGSTSGAPMIAAGSGVPGANSFTEAQATHMIEAAGYSHVTGLAKDKDGIWRGTGTKGSAQATVGVDYKGNVVTR
jgi:hypothetical protein